ncbi:MAG: S1 RNA-binding domain-containing protein [Actinobacteria bacterium]|nr:S1 RNA-binding domain-containing protein [Actinomycetota bacterium]
MDWEQVKQTFTPGKRVKTTIDRIDYYGLFTQLEGGIVGYVRRDEALLTRKITDLNNHFVVGESRDAVVVKPLQRYHSIELSFRQAERDPWLEFLKTNPVGSILEGEIVLLTESKAWIEFEPGVVGLLQKNEMWLRAPRVEDVFMIYDRVRIKTIGVDEENKYFILSVRALFDKELDRKSEHATYTIEESLNEALEIFHWEQNKQTTRDIGLSDRCHESIHSIAIIDDRDVTAAPLSLMLEGFGFKAEFIPYFTDSVSRLEKQDFDLYLVAAGLANEQDPFAIALKKKYPKAGIVVYGTSEQFEALEGKLAEAELGGYFLLIPYTSLDLAETLNQFAGKNIKKRREIKGEILENISWEDEKTHLPQEGKSIDQLLKEIKTWSAATFAVIFKMNLNTKDVEIFAAEGKEFELSSFDKGHLQFSPIKDAIADGELIDEPQGSGKIKYLRCLGQFESIVGIRISFNDEFGYALFLFGEHRHQFSHIEKRTFQVYELALRAAIERNKFKAVREAEQKFLVAGRIAAGLMHEIKNQIQAMQNWLEGLKTDSVNLNKGIIKTNDKAFLARFERSINGALEIEKRTRKIEELFLDLMRTSRLHTVNVCHFIDSFIEVMQPLAREKKISIETSIEKCPPIETDISALHQILLNLFMNSLDFIPLVRKRTGKIKIAVKYRREDPVPIKIEFWDNGPGINEKQKEKIFDMLFTTKPEGSGLGLYISRRLAGSLGGKLYVSHTIRLSESTFVLELPKRKKGGTANA